MLAYRIYVKAFYDVGANSPEEAEDILLQEEDVVADEIEGIEEMGDES